MSGNDKISNFLKSSLLQETSELEKKVQWIWSKEEPTTNKVDRLSQTCAEQLESLFQCEYLNGANNKECEPYLARYNQCLSKNICPKEYLLKDLFCFGNSELLQQQSKTSSILNQIDEKEKNDFCKQFSLELKNCINSSLSKIWSSNP